MSKQIEKPASTVTVRTLAKMKSEGKPIVCLTAYDASFASIVDEAGVDVVLVGDSLGMVIQGHDSTLPVTMEDMLYHCRAVSRGVRRALLMFDMPFLSYTSPAVAVANAGRAMKEAGAHMVKLEGGSEQTHIVEALVANGIPVCAHLGLQPQRVHKIGGYRVQGREAHVAEHMLQEALALEKAGADVVLLECVPAALAEEISRNLDAPVIGIGAGAGVDGQILVLYDILNIPTSRKPKFCKDFIEEGGSIVGAVRAYVEAVTNGDFPGPENTF